MTTTTLPTRLTLTFPALSLDVRQFAALALAGLVSDDGAWKRTVGYLTYARSAHEGAIECDAVLHPGASWALEAMFHRGMRLTAVPQWQPYAVALVTIYHPGITPGPGPAGHATITKGTTR